MIDDTPDPAVLFAASGRVLASEHVKLLVATIQQAIDDASCIADKRKPAGNVYQAKADPSVLLASLDEEAANLRDFLDADRPFGLAWCCAMIESICRISFSYERTRAAIEAVMAGTVKPVTRARMMTVGTATEILAFEDYRERERARNRRRGRGRGAAAL